MTLARRPDEPVHLTSLDVRHPTDASADRFPFSVPAIRALDRLELGQPVTFLVGENGSGKSTLLEGLAAAAKLPAIGAESLDRDPTLADQRALARRLKLSWYKRTHRGFFLRAEDFFGYAKSLARQRVELQEDVARVEEEYRDRSAYAKQLALGPIAGSAAAFEARYREVESVSHGQSFLRLFQSRFVPDGLYILDEPEAPLSPQSQLALLALIADGVARSSQFIIATHSPILMAYPRAQLLMFDGRVIREASLSETPHYQLTRNFVMNPKAMMDELFAEVDAELAED
jgi:predicted ATPase